MTTRTFLQAIRDAQYEEMQRDPRVFVMGEDVECNMFGTTTGIIPSFGKERVRDTPISEAGMTGVAAGAAMVGMRPIVDYTIAPFLYPAMDQIISIVAKSRFLYGGQDQGAPRSAGEHDLWQRQCSPAFRSALQHVHAHARAQDHRSVECL